MIFNSIGSNYSFKFVARTSLPVLPVWRPKLHAYLRQRYNAQSVTLVYKGRQAITEALRRMEAPEGATVLVNGFTCYAVDQAVRAAGYTPVFVDIADRTTLNASSHALINAASTKQAVAVLVQNSMGYPADMQTIEALAGEYGLTIIEDMAHCIGLKYTDGREVGTVGDFACLSFSQDKVVDAVSGGALIDRRETATAITELSQGQVSLLRRIKDKIYPSATWKVRTFYSLYIGKVIHALLRKFKATPQPMEGSTEMQFLPHWNARAAYMAFKNLDSQIAHRQTIAAMYREHLPDEMQFAHEETATYIRFPIQVSDPAGLKEHLRSLNIHISDTWYDAAVGPKKSLNKASYEQGSCPISEYVAERMINLPTHINVSEEDAKQICEGVNAWLHTGK